jgi:exopolyphosphatase/guanosine-5'-triphosphate,3'-diphosphate pyrophosphatase
LNLAPFRADKRSIALENNSSRAGTAWHDMLAAVDLGSNSFHLQVGRVVGEQIYLLDSLREPVQLGAGLTRDGRIDRATQMRALEALERFGERLRRFSRTGVRAVGTNALRVARDSEAFLLEAGEALGFPIEVVFGREEARLIYLGVAHSLPPSPEPRLVMDIGGGSTEFVIGRALEPQLMESISMGCVSWSLRFFPDGIIDKGAFKKAELAAANEMQRMAKSYRRAGWSQAIASSGTAKSIATILAANGFNGSATEGGGRFISREGVDRLRALLLRHSDVSRLNIDGLREDRKATFPGGLAILSAAMRELEIDQFSISDGALRQGVLYDLLGRVTQHDMREVTVREFARRYHVDQAHCARVADLSARILGQLISVQAPDDQLLLRFAAILHEIGITIAHAGYHKHSAYIISQADMPGFSRDEQARLARLVLAHRGKLSKIAGLPARSPDWNLIFSLRLAALFRLSRGDVPLPPIACRNSSGGYQISIPSDWLNAHPLTEAALQAEAAEWHTLGMRVELRAMAAT